MTKRNVTYMLITFIHWTMKKYASIITNISYSKVKKMKYTTVEEQNRFLYRPLKNCEDRVLENSKAVLKDRRREW